MTYKPFGVLRTVLALLVIVQHVDHVGPAGMSWHSWATGTIAVMVFFCLSGYVITEAAERFYRGRPIQFALNRALRIMPQYVLSLALSVASIALVVYLQPSSIPNSLVTFDGAALLAPDVILLNIFMVLPGIGKEAPTHIPYVWALRAEVIFYAMLMLVICVSIYKRSIAFAGLIVSATLLFISYLAGVGQDIFQFVPFFAMGMIAYFTFERPSARRYAALAAVFALSVWTCVSITIPTVFTTTDLTFRQLVFQTLLFSILIVAFFFLVNFRLSEASAKVDRAIGDLSYPLYLQQHAVILLAMTFLPHSYWTVAAVFVATLVVASLTDIAVDIPLRAVRDRIRGRTLTAS